MKAAQAWFPAIAILLTGAVGATPNPAPEPDPVMAAEPATEAQSEEPATARSSATRALESITVTAQRRDEPLQKVPIAVSAVTAPQIERANITETLSIARVVPNLFAHNNTGLGSANVYAMRGLGNTESIATFDPPVGTYVDDVFIARQNANNFALFDVERIEVLRGPQGTLFGRNTTGGAINVILKKPAEAFGGYIDAGVGSFGRLGFRGSVDLPISPDVLTKFSAYRYADDGFVDNPITGERLNGETIYGVRGALRWFMSDRLRWDLSVDYSYSDHLSILNFSRKDPPENLVDLARERFQPGYIAEAVRAANFCRAAARRDRYACTTLSVDRPAGAGFLAGRKAETPLGAESGTYSVISNLEWGLESASLNWIAGWRRTQQDFAVDFFNGNFFINNPTVPNPNPPPATIPAPSGTPFPGAIVGVGPQGGFTIVNDGRHRQLTNELKLTGSAADERLQYVAGMFWLRERNRTDFGDLFGLSPTTTLVLEDRILYNDTDSFAVYAQADWDFGSGWIGTLGGRWTAEDKSIDYVANPNPRLVRPACSSSTPQSCRVESSTIAAFAPLEQSTRIFTPRVAINKELTEAVSMYASATRGFKSGGWNARGTTPDQIQPFRPEKIWSYELGLRSELIERTLRMNLTAFRYEVEDFQLPSAFVQANGAITFITRNFAGLENRGLEAEFLYQPDDALTLFLNLGFQDAKYVDLDPSILAQQARCRAALAGAPQPPQSTNPRLAALADCALGIVNDRGEIADPVRTPDTIAAGGSYRIDLGGFAIEPTLTWTRVGSQTLATAGNPVGRTDAFNTWTAGVRFEQVGGPWSARLACQNCGDAAEKHTVLSQLPYLIEPRTWSLDVMYRF